LVTDPEKHVRVVLLSVSHSGLRTIVFVTVVQSLSLYAVCVALVPLQEVLAHVVKLMATQPDAILFAELERLTPFALQPEKVA
jgi:hypothetical protein